MAPEPSGTADTLPLTLLLRPLPLLAVALLAVNDHVLKGLPGAPSWLTGKLSDVAGLFFFPLLLVVLGNLAALALALLLPGRPAFAPTRRVLLMLASPRLHHVLWAAGLTGAAFAAVQMLPWAARAYGAASALCMGKPGHIARVTMDVTDLAALLVLPVCVWWARGQLGRVPPGRLRCIRAGLEPHRVLRDLPIPSAKKQALGAAWAAGDHHTAARVLNTLRSGRVG